MPLKRCVMPTKDGDVSKLEKWAIFAMRARIRSTQYGHMQSA
jgi:hypothetical protein